MKKIILTLLTILPILIFAQTEGTIQYKETIALQIELPEGMEEFAAQIPKSQASNMVLTFTNVAEGTMVNKQEFMGKKFLIKGEVEKYKWKLTGEQETILDYPCQKATYQDSTRNYVAWFTPQIPVAAGPGGISGLPGMILKLDRDEGQMIIEATAVDLKKLEKNAIKPPKKGKKVTKEEFKKIQEEKMKEMEEELGGSGNRVIIQN